MVATAELVMMQAQTETLRRLSTTMRSRKKATAARAVAMLKMQAAWPLISSVMACA